MDGFTPAKYFRILIFLFGTVVFGWLFTGYKEMFISLLLGLTVALFNMWNLFYHAKRFGTVNDNGKIRYTIGVTTRVFTSIVATLIVMRFPNYFAMIPMIFGLMTNYILFAVVSGYTLLKAR